MGNRSYAPVGRDGGAAKVRRTLQLDGSKSAEHFLTAVVVMFGLLFATLLVPNDVEPRAALQIPALVFVIALSLIPVITILRDPKAVFKAEHVVMLGPVYWLLLDPLQGRFEMRGLERDAVERAFLAIALFVAGAWVGCIQKPWRLPRSVQSVARSNLTLKFYYGIGIVSFVLAFCKYAIPAKFDPVVMITSLQGGRWAGPWQRGDLGGADAFLDHLAYFGYLLPPLTAIVARRIGWTNHRTIVLACGGVILSAFLIQGGGRRLVGFYVGSGLLVWFLESPRIRMGTVLALAATFAGMLLLSEQMLSNRNGGVFAGFFSEATAQESGADDDGVFLRVDDNFLRLAQMTEIFPAEHDYTTWQYPLWVAVRPVPRLFWPGKPLNPGFDLPAFLGQKGVSYSSSVVGELFMAGGFLATAVGGWFYGRLARSLSHLLEQARTSSGLIIYSIGVFALFIGLRSMIELVLTSYVILAWVLLVRLYDTRRQGRPAPLPRAANFR